MDQDWAAVGAAIKARLDEQGMTMTELATRPVGRRLPPATSDLLKDAPYIVDFCDPSPTTALPLS